MRKFLQIMKILLLGCFLIGCSNNILEEAKALMVEEQINEQVVQEVNNINFSQFRDSDNLSLSFPYVKLPQGYEIIDNPITEDNQQMFVSYKGKLISYTGKTYKMRVGNESFNNYFSFADFVQLFEKNIYSQGGELISDLFVLDDDLQINKPNLDKLQSDISINYFEDEVKTYLINPKSNRPILIQLIVRSSSALIHVIEVFNT